MILAGRAVAMAIVLAVAGCAPAAVSGNDAVGAAFRDHRSELQVTLTGTVTRLLADQEGPNGPHQRFIVELSASRQTVLILNNLTVGRRVPVRESDTVRIHGEYVWNEQGGLVHFTHHDPDRSHEGGWIEHRDIRYE